MFIRNENLKDYFRQYPVTASLIVLNILVFIVVSLNGGSTNLENLINYGAMFKSSVEEGEYYRLFTSMFLHIGFAHLLFNMFSLYVFSCELEKIIGHIKYLVVYLISGLGAGVFVFFFSAYGAVTAGASGAIFGIFGAMFVAMKINGHLFDPHSKKTFQIILLLNVIFTFFGNASVSGHIGGLITGTIIGYLLLKK